MDRNAREAARIIRHIEANVLGVIGEILARPKNRRQLLRTTARGPARQKIKRQLAAFERLVETAKRPCKTGGRTGKKERKGKVSQCPL